MSKIIKYLLAWGSTPKGLSDTVGEYIKLGMQPFGSPFIESGSLSGGVIFYQAMVLYEQ